MSNDPFVQENVVPTSWDDGYWDREGQSQCNQGCPQYGGYTCPINHNQLAAQAVNKGCHDGTDNCKLEEGTEDMGFGPNDYEGAEELPSLPSTTASLLPPHIKAA